MKKLRCLMLIIVSLFLTACGLREIPEPSFVQEENCPVAVAVFSDMELPVPLKIFRQYAMDNSWFYTVYFAYNQEGEYFESRVFRSGLEQEFQAEVWLVRPKLDIRVILPDGAGGCILFSQSRAGEGYYLEKYDENGGCVWQVNYEAEDLEGQGENLTEGAVASDGRIFLFGYDGTGSTILGFDSEGNRERIYRPSLEALHGLVAGAENGIYGYCPAGDSVLFENLEDGSRYVCPVVPEKVFGGEDGIYLSDKEGLWRYEPETDCLEQQWSWEDEYLNVDSGRIDRIICSGDEFRLLCYSTEEYDVYEISFVRIRYEDSSEYPPKQPVYLGTGESPGGTELSGVAELVRLYNRQSKGYQVKVVYYGEELTAETVSSDLREAGVSELERQIFRGEGLDIVDASTIHADSLVLKGVFDELTGYYASGSAVQETDLLDVVREGGYFEGHHVFVIPSFYLYTMLSKTAVEPKDWTPWRLLELGSEQPLSAYNSKRFALRMCLGINNDGAGRFVDYETGKCYFDSEEFAELLKACSRMKECVTQAGNIIFTDDFLDAEYMLSDWHYIRNLEDYLADTQQLGEEMIIGYPGWDGAETAMVPKGMFAICSASQNKEGAWDFLEYIMSAELQERIDWGFPSRRDSFEDYLENSYFQRKQNSELFAYTFITWQPKGGEAERLRSLVERAVCYRGGIVSNPIWNIVSEEADMYFAGDAGLEDTVQKIQSRVQLYLDEQ